MASQLVLAWTVDVTNTSFGPAQAAAALAAVPLYTNPATDPVLGQLFGLSVDTDVTTTDAKTATRTLTLNMGPNSLPPFPCHPDTASPPTLPYTLRKAVALAGSFLVTTGSTVVPTTATQVPALVAGSVVQFLSQQGVFYTLAAPPTATQIVLTTPYTGVAANTGAFQLVAAPAQTVAVYSTSDSDTDAVAGTVPPIPAGPGAHLVVLEYNDSTGALFAAFATMTGRRPAPMPLAPGSKDIAVIQELVIATVGGFGNSVGQITLSELSAPVPPLPADTTPDQFHAKLTDEAQLLLERHLAYLPPSYFALAQQGASKPYLAGDFILTTGSTSVQTTVDQTSVLAPGNVIQFAEQLQRYTPFGKVDVFYTVATVTPKIVTLTTPFDGVDRTFTGTDNVNTNIQTKGNLGTQIIKRPSAALLVSPSPASPPTDAQLAAPLSQSVNPGIAAPPPNPPLSPTTMTPAVTTVTPVLAGTFAVVNGSANVLTTVDQTSALSPGNAVQFASQPGVVYVVASLTAAALTLATPYTGTSNAATTATRVTPTNFLSDLFTQTLQLALAGVPITPQPIAVI